MLQSKNPTACYSHTTYIHTHTYPRSSQPPPPPPQQKIEKKKNSPPRPAGCAHPRAARAWQGASRPKGLVNVGALVTRTGLWGISTMPLIRTPLTGSPLSWQHPASLAYPRLWARIPGPPRHWALMDLLRARIRKSMKAGSRLSGSLHSLSNLPPLRRI